MDQDIQHIKLLSTFHYVVGALAVLFGCFPFIHLAVGIGLLLSGDDLASGGEAPPALIGWIFIGIASIIIIIGWTVAVCLFVSGKFLARHSHYKFCFITACIACLFMPFGTVLGVFTIIVLSRPQVKELFETQ